MAIPDISEDEIIGQDVAENTNNESVVAESESFDEILSKENTVIGSESPFVAGGDDNE